MKKLFVVIMAIGLFMALAPVSFAGIVGSAHDFSGSPFSGGQICVLCHAPHNNAATNPDAPLWNHEVTTATYTLYSSPSMDATVNQPGGSSRLCLSCHDGTVAVDSFGGATGTFFITGTSNLTTDLSDDHPISFTYDTALASTDGGLYDPASTSVTIGSGAFTRTGTIQDELLTSDNVECSSCHSVHNDFVAGGIGGQPLLKISKLSSAICLACHNK